MIVTFQIAVYLIYHVWESYISVLFRSEDSGPRSNESRRDRMNSSSLSREIQTEPDHNEIGLNRNEPNFMVTRNEHEMNQESEDLHNIVEEIYDEEDEGKRIIYNIEPKFASIDSEERGITFIPPVYTQRYMIIESILKEPCWAEQLKKVVDFGCAELGFEFRHLKKLLGIREIVSVDIDTDILSYYCCKMSPSPIDYLQPRSTPLKVKVFCGSVGHTNEILLGTDAVIAIELIEHLFPGDLENLPFTVFGFIKPKIAMFTTPNADFNVLFHNFSGFRHSDHKFEWSRQQFEDWGNNLMQRYPDYTVTYQGVGPGRPGTEHLGCCSQMAVFVKVHESHSITEEEMHIQDGPYTLIQEYIYPYYVDKRSREEKIRDDAVAFINRCILLSRQYDDETAKELPLKMIMERIKCHNTDKLKVILIKDHWEVRSNESGNEVVILPDSDNEDQDFSSENSEEYNRFNENSDSGNCAVTLTSDENWDCENIESEIVNNNTFSEALAVDCMCIPDNSFPGSNTSFVNNSDDAQTLNSSSTCNYSENCSVSKTVIPNDSSVVCDSFISSQTVIVPGKETALYRSMYETPYNNWDRNMESECDLHNPCAQSLHHDQSNNQIGCTKALSFETPDIFKECHSVTEYTKSDSFCSAPSPSEASTYITPSFDSCKKYIPKCLSLQQISAHCCSSCCLHEFGNSSEKYTLIGEHKDKFSKSMEGFKIQESCDKHETCSNTSKVVDSGYPDSYSERNMDMDMTPEQFDDIETESEGNVSSSSSPLPPILQILHIIDDVENGDVANNNRDGEGNNVVGDMEQEPLEFEAQIEEVNNEIPNLAAFNHKIHENEPFLQNNHKSCEIDENIPIMCCSLTVGCVDSSYSMISQKSCNSDDSETGSFLRENKIMLEPIDKSSTILSDKQKVKSTQSDSSLVTISSWSHLGSKDSQSCFDMHESATKLKDRKLSPKLKAHNSLTTVIDGCSKFSNCSIVHPDISTEMSEQGDNTFPRWMTSIDKSLFEFGENLKGRDSVAENNTLHGFYSSLQLDRLSVQSIYQSAASLSSLLENSPFPQWMLDIKISDSDEIDLDSTNSAVTVWDSDSFEDLDGLNYDLEIDARGGGDPQTETWH